MRNIMDVKNVTFKKIRDSCYYDVDMLQIISRHTEDNVEIK